MRYFNQRCCTEPFSLPYTSRMYSDILQSYNKLWERYDKSITKREKIWKLAVPKHMKSKYRRKIKYAERTTCQVEIINKTDKTEHTRTEQLAFPKLRQLYDLKKNPSFKSFDSTRKSGVNRLIRKNLLSLYSRLQNVTPEKKTQKTITWGSQKNANLLKRLKSLAEPKKLVSLCEEEFSFKPQGREVGPNLRRIRKLSKPRIRKSKEPHAWILTAALKYFKPTERLLKMAQPRKYETSFEEAKPFLVPPIALSYKATSRIKTLAEPAKSKMNIEQRKENPFQTSACALKAVASKRVQELATPKEYSDMSNRGDPYRVSRRALQAKATPRLIELAEPRRKKEK
ncbi:uncharacterized protein LOC106083954 [Stomoxys calcitrans]|uniref:uncharacterized protein LOC106083954 n=1 Tax=Stomoxys calcitrans TaxID=35570 RepID=UPI0027E36645|nr:uncharacterized protein LOC106083954 [Stomoxys calcitrans]